MEEDHQIADDELEDEVEILQEIYISELEVRRGASGKIACVSLRVHPATGDQDHLRWVCLTLELRPPPGYPYVPPDIRILNPRGLSEQHVRELEKELAELAESRCGVCMLFELIDCTRESLTEGNKPHGECAICQDGFTEDETFTKTDCYHYFHCDCMLSYVTYTERELEEEYRMKLKAAPHTIVARKPVVCPVCRDPITYDLEFLRSSPKRLGLNEDQVTLSPEIRKLQKDMKRLFMHQQAKGGIIDLEEEKNRYLISAAQNLPDSTTQEDKSGGGTLTVSPKLTGAIAEGNSDSQHNFKICEQAESLAKTKEKSSSFKDQQGHENGKVQSSREHSTKSGDSDRVRAKISSYQAPNPETRHANSHQRERYRDGTNREPRKYSSHPRPRRDRDGYRDRNPPRPHSNASFRPEESSEQAAQQPEDGAKSRPGSGRNRGNGRRNTQNMRPSEPVERETLEVDANLDSKRPHVERSVADSCDSELQGHSKEGRTQRGGGRNRGRSTPRTPQHDISNHGNDDVNQSERRPEENSGQRRGRGRPNRPRYHRGYSDRTTAPDDMDERNQQSYSYSQQQKSRDYPHTSGRHPDEKRGYSDRSQPSRNYSRGNRRPYYDSYHRHTAAPHRSSQDRRQTPRQSDDSRNVVSGSENWSTRRETADGDTVRS